MDYILYCRKSSEAEDRQVMSLDSQERELTELAQKLGINIIDTYRESKSAKDFGRPEFNKMIKRIQKSKTNVGILTWKLDRLARNFIDGGLVIDLLQKSVIHEIKTPEMAYKPDDNVLPMSVIFGMANQYSRDLSANVKRGNREKLNRGEWINRAPFGYVNDRNTKLVVIDEIQAPFVKDIFETYATGKYSFKDVSKIMYAKGLRSHTGRRIFASLIHRVINRTFYYGVMEVHGKFYPGKHEPLIDKKLFDICQEIQKPKTRPRPQKHFFPYRGLFTCDTCNCAITAEKQKGYSYYHCTNGKGACNQKKQFTRGNQLTEQLANVFTVFDFDTELIEMMYQASKQKIGTQEDTNTKVVQTLEKHLISLQGKESRLVDTYTSGQIPQELYNSKILEIQNERVNLKKQLEESRQNNIDPLNTLERTKEAFLTSIKAKSRLLEVNPEQKRNTVFELLSNATLHNKNIAQLNFKKPYNILAKVPKNPTFAQLLTELNKVRTEILSQPSPFFPEFVLNYTTTL